MASATEGLAGSLRIDRTRTFVRRPSSSSESTAWSMFASMGFGRRPENHGGADAALARDKIVLRELVRERGAQ